MTKIFPTYRHKEIFFKSIIHDFEVSIIIPILNNLKSFKESLSINAAFYQRNGIEVILVINSPSEEDPLIHIIKSHPFINWKVIICAGALYQLNLSQIINIGIRHATKEYLMVSSPNVEFITDIILQLRTLLANFQNHYAICQFAYIGEKDALTEELIKGLIFENQGIIMASKASVELVSCYDEELDHCYNEEYNIRKRLELAGIKKLFLPEARAVIRKPSPCSNIHSDRILRKIYYPNVAVANGECWGRGLSRISYNWQSNIYAEELCRTYLNNFLEFSITDSDIFKKKYKKLILCQAYNEVEYISGFLENMAVYFDGIILLDDQSTDNTWNLAKHEKLLLKVKKQRNGFDDLGNRNILLDIASFLDSDWFCFMDIDERFDNRFVNFDRFENNPDIEVVSFSGIYLWDNVNTYNGSIPNSNKGILKVLRMFRNKGRMQVMTFKTKLHFVATPYTKNIESAEILFKDYGSLTQERRIAKHKMYTIEDQNQDLPSGYDYLLDNHSPLQKLNAINSSLLAGRGLPPDPAKSVTGKK